MKKLISLIVLFSVGFNLSAQENYRAYIVRLDNKPVVFNINTATEKGEKVFYINNATEKIRISPVVMRGDSVFFSMPVFESSFSAKQNADGSMQGVWIKGTSGGFQRWPFYAFPNQNYRFAKSGGNAKENISGKWDVTITWPNGLEEKALAEFEQQDNHLTGTFLTTTGDYRYLEGIVTGDSLKLSTFDGAHAYAFTAKIENDKEISGGEYNYGIADKETWKAVKDDNVKPPVSTEATKLRKGDSTLNFTFKDLDDKPVSIKDERFKDKVVIIQIMGSWCPNCMDETKFLADYYKQNRDRDVEVIALAYEYTTNEERSKNSLRKFQQRLDVQYPMLITGVTSGDEEKTEKTLPQLTPIQTFPTTIFLDKKGKVREIHQTFYGPGTGQYFIEYEKMFSALVNGLLKE